MTDVGLCSSHHEMAIGCHESKKVPLHFTATAVYGSWGYK